MMDDKSQELRRYDQRAIKELEFCSYLGADASKNYLSMEDYLRSPYDAFVREINSRLASHHKVLEIGAGTGAWTEALLRTGAMVCATDISPLSLTVLNRRLNTLGRLETKVADMEGLPFFDQQFDFVVSAGSLSYGDNVVVRDEIFRVLKNGGCFVCVDSLNHNPIYKINRWFHFLRGNRSRSTLIRMPTVSIIESYFDKFGSADVSYFGSISWLMPILSPFFKNMTLARLSKWFDKTVDVRRSGFKFLMVAKKTNYE